MSKLKIPHSAGWFVAGVLTAVLLIPSAVTGAASVLGYTGIEGATGGTYANVTRAGQVEVTNAGASQMFVHPIKSTALVPGGVGAPNGEALIITSVNVWGNSGAQFQLYIVSKNVRVFIEEATATSAGTVIPFNPGLVIPAGQKIYISGDEVVNGTVVGYTVPASAG
jgi:hypothetical protein